MLEKDTCDDELGNEVTAKPQETLQFRSSKEPDDAVFLPRTWESTLCLSFP